jgi:hypothetical protein
MFRNRPNEESPTLREHRIRLKWLYVPSAVDLHFDARLHNIPPLELTILSHW